MDEDLMYGVAAVVATLFAGLTIFVPVVAITLRFALRPVLETWARIRQGEPSESRNALLERRLSLLETELQQMQLTLEQLAEAQDFQRRLAEPAPREPRLPPLAVPERPGGG